jgi:hypothetical protein
MRMMLAALALLFAGTALDSAQADPYRWCAVYGGSEFGGSSNCYFITLEQCRAAVSGNGGFCTINQFYTGDSVDALRRRGRPAR